MSSFQLQFRRVERFLSRIENQGRNPVDYEDDVLAFFQNCWHLRDWIEKDATVPQHIRDKVYADAIQVDCLRMCADLANGSKHLILTRRGKPVDGAEVVRRGVMLFPDEAGGEKLVVPGEPEVRVRLIQDFIIRDTDGTEHWALDLARDAVEAWKELIAGYGLHLN